MICSGIKIGDYWDDAWAFDDEFLSFAENMKLQEIYMKI